MLEPGPNFLEAMTPEERAAYDAAGAEYEARYRRACEEFDASYTAWEARYPQLRTAFDGLPATVVELQRRKNAVESALAEVVNRAPKAEKEIG